MDKAKGRIREYCDACQYETGHIRYTSDKTDIAECIICGNPKAIEKDFAA